MKLTLNFGRIAKILACAALPPLCTSAQPAYDTQNMQKENLGRGLVCVNSGDSTIISWRLLPEDYGNTYFNIYRDNKLVNTEPIKGTTFIKVKSYDKPCIYSVRTVDGGRESGRKNADFAYDPSQKDYLSIPLSRPEAFKGTDGKEYVYNANDASVGDVDGDGEYELILKWDPSNSRDNSQEGVTGNVFIDCYKFNTSNKDCSNLLWRIDLGRNIRAGAHYTQFMVYDFDGDGKSEIIMKTADGTKDGVGKFIGDANANHVFSGIIEKNIPGKAEPVTQEVRGRIFTGNEYVTVFDGATGAALKTVDYIPPRGDVSSWGDNYGNRVDRFLAAVAYLDGKHPSYVTCRGYYTKTYLTAYDWDGKDLKVRWIFDSEKIDSVNRAKDPTALPYSGQGNHNLRVGDVDGDGCDEITYGSMAVDNDGTGLYTTGMGHGDALHLFAFYPDRSSLQIWDVHENKKDGSDFRDAKTGRVIFQIKSGDDVGRGMAADIDPTNHGLEMWSASQKGYYDVNGKQHFADKAIPQNSAVWWDGDLLRELLDKTSILKFDWTTGNSNVMKDFKQEGCLFNNGTKQNPCLSADIFGDWREEVVVRSEESSELRIYTTTIPTEYRFVTFMADPMYRISVATENVGYNQPPEQSFYFGSEMKTAHKK